MNSLNTEKSNLDGVTLRSFLIGLFLTALAVIMAHYSVNIVHSSHMAVDHMPVAAISLFFTILIFLHILITIIKRPFGLSPAELLLIYIIVFVGCSVTTMGLGSQILSIMGAPHYYSTPANRWGELILPHIKSWLIPQDKEAVRQFFEGMPKGGSIPWMVWIKPLLCWLPFLISLYVVMICIPVIMRRQWIEKERLQFPLARLPIEMVKKEKRGNVLVYSFFYNKLMWLGFAIPFLISTINSLHKYFHVIPTVDLLHAISIFRNTHGLAFWISFPVIGFLFLVSTKLAFSLWLFGLCSVILTGWFKITGIASSESLGIYGTKDVILNHLGTGALVVFVLYGLWIARSHLKEVFRKAFLKNSTLDDSQELLSYRSAVIALILGIIFMTIWLTFSGLSPIMAFLFVILALIIFLGITRVVIEGGIPTLISPGIAAPQLISSIGTSALGSSGLTSLAFSFIYSADIRTFVMSAAANSVRIAEDIKKKRKLIFWAMLGAILVSIIISLWIELHHAYTYGGINLSWHFTVGCQVPFNLIKEKIVHPTPPNGLGWGCKLIGGVIMTGFMFMHTRFLWWPFHPIGFVAGYTNWVQHLWFSIFISWLLKSFILRYGGPKIYRNAIPFFLGLVLGQYVVAVLWFVIDLITGMTGNVLFWV